MDYRQRNSINEKCYKCKYLSFWGSGYYCSNKYACINNSKLHELKIL